MKKIALAGILTLALAATASAASMPSGLSLMGQAGFNPDHGGTGSTGVVAMYRGIGGDLYVGGDHSNNRGGGLGGDLRIDSGLFGIGLLYGKQHSLTLYGEAGVAWQQGAGAGPGTGPAVSPTPVATAATHLVDDKITFEGGGGINYNYALNDKHSLVWSLGYHTNKGVNTGFGVTFW